MSRYPRTIMATCCVPWRPDWTLDEPVFRTSIRNLAEQGLRDLYVFGTAGEGYAVNERQFDEVVGIFQEETAALGIPPMVGVISLSLSTIIERIERCQERGISLFQISLPSWGVLNDRELQTFFAETCDRFPAARFLHYNLRRSGRLVTPTEYADLAARHPNLVATKNGLADTRMIIGLQQQAVELRHFLTEGGYASGSLLGDFGFLVSIASINPGLAREFYEAGVRRDAAALGALGRELSLMSNDLHAAPGPGVYIDGAYDKVFCKLHDPAFSLRLLPPYQGWRDEAFARFRELLATRYPRWLGPGDADA
jgi:dihydrodipicolinate synthase/N-acetylneuraminate lyase